MKKYLALFLLIFQCFCIQNAQAWNQELVDAVAAIDSGSATPRQQALVVQHNVTINQMRIKGLISDQAYQRSQLHYAEVVEAMAIEASRQHGASMQVQRRDPNNDRKQVYDAGTDSDFITDAKSVQQAKNIKQSFNQRFSDYLQKHGLQVPANSDWTKINDIDFMVSPEGLSVKTFEDISAVNNDAYKRPDAARYEAKKRIGADISVKETIAYIDEMRDFVAKKQRISAELSQKLRDLKKNKAAEQSGSAEYAERMRIETELQQVHAQQGKYFDRIGEANNRLATMNQTGEAVSNLSGQEKINAEIMNQAKVLASDLPDRGKVRAPDAEVSAKQRQIASATVNASEQHLMSQGKLSEAMLLAVLANRSPENAEALHKRIVEISKDLSPSQRGELIERLKNNPKVDNQLVSRINQGMQDTAKTSSIGSESSSANKSKVKAPAGSLTKAGTGAGWVGDIMSINDQLKKAEEGQNAAYISLNVLTKSSGNKVYSKTINRLRKPKADGSQRVGMKLGKDIISKRGNYTFEAVITAADGTTDRKAIDFSISSYSLAIILPSHLTSGETGHFSIQLPNEFSKPFSVNIDMDSNLTISHGRGALSGSLVGVAEKRDSKMPLYATVTDSAGRVARGNGDLLVEAIPEPEPEPEPLYLPPPTYKPLLVQSSEPVSEPEPELEEDYAATYRNIMQDYNDKLAEIKRQEKANEAEYQAALGSSHTSSSSPSQRSGFRRCFQQTENRGYRATILLKGSGNWDDRVRTLSLKDCSNGTAFTEQLTVCGLNLYIDGYDVQEKKEMLFNNTFMAFTLKNLIKRGCGGITHPNTEVCSVGVRPANW